MSNSIGNLKNSGLQGNNFPWQLKMLVGQQCACDQLQLANDILQEIDNNTDQVEPLLLQILTAIQNGSDFEAFLVVDANDVTWLEVRIWNPATGTFDPPVYFLAGTNTPGTPAAPISYINPNTYLAQIVSNTTGLATETTLGNIYTELSGTIDVNVTNPTLVVDQGTSPWIVSATALDIRPLDCDTDSIKICDGTTDLGINLDGSINTQSSTLDGAGTAITSTTIGSQTGLDVNVLIGNIPIQLENLEVTGAIGDLSAISNTILSVSFISNGTANASVSVNGGSTFISLSPGTTLNFDSTSPTAYIGTSFHWDTTPVGASLIVIYSYI